MKTPAQYKKLLTDLALDQLPTDGKTPDEVQTILAQLNERHSQLHDLEVNLNQDIHTLRSQYQGKLAPMGINSRRKIQIGEEQRVEAEQDARLSPYEEIKKQLQTLLAQIEERQAKFTK